MESTINGIRNMNLQCIALGTCSSRVGSLLLKSIFTFCFVLALGDLSAWSEEAQVKAASLEIESKVQLHQIKWVIIKPEREVWVLIPRALTPDYTGRIFRLTRSLLKRGSFSVTESDIDTLATRLWMRLTIHSFRILSNWYEADLANQIVSRFLSSTTSSFIRRADLKAWIEQPEKQMIQTEMPAPLQFDKSDFFSSFFFGLTASQLYQLTSYDLNHSLFFLASSGSWWIARDLLYFKLKMTKRLDLPDIYGKYLAGLMMTGPAVCHFLLTELGA